VLFVARHTPAASQKSVVHTLPSLHTRGVPVHAPAAQWSESVHGLPSLHWLAFGT
jgi:hypothetical protein